MPVISKKVYITPSIMFAYIDRAHPKHDQADAFIRFFAQEQYQLYTDYIAITHTYKLIYDNISPSLSKDFMRIMQVTNINIIYPEEPDFKAAVKVIVGYQSTELMFPEALMAVLASKRSINQICTFDYLHSLFGLELFYLPI